MKKLLFVFASLALLGCPPPEEIATPTAQEAACIAQVQSGVAVAVILDSSGSMEGSKLQSVKTILKTSIQEKLGFYDVMGSGKLHVAIIDCGSNSLSDASVILPMSTYNEANYQKALNQLVGGGGTPLGACVALAYEELAKSGCNDKHIFILSDGQSGDSVADALQNRVRTTSIHVIGFQTDVMYYSDFANVGGQVIMADDTAALDNTTNAIFKAILKLEDE